MQFNKVNKRDITLLVFMLLSACSPIAGTRDSDTVNTSFDTKPVKNNQLVTDEGVVRLRSDHFNSHFTIYNLDKTVWKSFVLNDEFDDRSLNPFALKAENNLLVFTFRGEDDGYYKVIIDESKGTLKYIRKDDPNFVFETWQDHLAEVFSVDFDYKSNPIRKMPNDSAAILPLEVGEDTFYRPVSTEGEWLKVETEKGSSGWVKWKDGDGKLLISIYYDA